MLVSHLPSLTAWPTFPVSEAFNGHDVRCIDLFPGWGGLGKFAALLHNPAINSNLGSCCFIPDGGEHPSEGGGNAEDQLLFARGQSTTLSTSTHSTLIWLSMYWEWARFTGIKEIRLFSHRNYGIAVSYHSFSPSWTLTKTMLALSSIILKLDFAVSEVTHGSPLPYSLPRKLTPLTYLAHWLISCKFHFRTPALFKWSHSIPWWICTTSPLGLTLLVFDKYNFPVVPHDSL